MRNKQGISIAALVVAIIGLSVGFAAFSNTLTIRSSADVHPDPSNFRVVFSKSTSSALAGNVSPDSSTYGTTANINSSDLTILENLHATFTEPGQSVTYPLNSDTLYVYNAGTYRAQLTGIEFEDAERLKRIIYRRGWRTHEPGDDTIKQEQPELIKDAISMMVDNNIKTRDIITDDLSIPPEDIASLCGLPSLYFNTNTLKKPLLRLIKT